MQKIRTFLWFDDRAEEAANFYASIFKNSRIDEVRPGPEGKAMSVSFTLEGVEFIALNGGPHFKFTPAISLFVTCRDQAEVDDLWARLLEGGEESRCGWLTDKFGLSWQIIPVALGEMLSDEDEVKAGRAMDAMLSMRKIDIAAMRAAFEGRAGTA